MPKRNAVQVAAYITGARLTDHSQHALDTPIPKADYTTTFTPELEPRPLRAIGHARAARAHALLGAGDGVTPAVAWAQVRAAGASEGSVPAHRFTMTLPRHLTPDQQLALAQRIGTMLQARTGAMVEMRVDRAPKSGRSKGKNAGATRALPTGLHEAHEATFLLSTRRVTPSPTGGGVPTFGAEIRDLALSQNASRWARNTRKRIKRLVDDSSREAARHAQTFDFTNKPGVVAPRIVGAPRSMDAEALFNAAERFAPRKDSVVARELTISLPHELSSDQQKQLASRIARHVHSTLGVAVLYAIHQPQEASATLARKRKPTDPAQGDARAVVHRRGVDARNVHVHLLFPRAPMDATSGTFARVSPPSLPPQKSKGGEQVRPRSRAQIAAYEKEWTKAVADHPALQLERRQNASRWLRDFRATVAEMANMELAKAGTGAHVEHRSLHARNVLQLPDIPLGPKAARSFDRYRERYEADVPLAKDANGRCRDAAEVQFRMHWRRVLLNREIVEKHRRLTEIEISLLRDGIDPTLLLAVPTPPRLNAQATNLVAEMRELRGWLRETFPPAWRMPWEPDRKSAGATARHAEQAPAGRQRSVQHDGPTRSR